MLVGAFCIYSGYGIVALQRSVRMRCSRSVAIPSFADMWLQYRLQSFYAMYAFAFSGGASTGPSNGIKLCPNTGGFWKYDGMVSKRCVVLGSVSIV